MEKFARGSDSPRRLTRSDLRKYVYKCSQPPAELARANFSTAETRIMQRNRAKLQARNINSTTAIAAIMRGVDSTDLLCERRAGVSLGERREKVRSGLRQSSAADTISFEKICLQVQSTACGTRPSKLFHGGDANQAAEQNGTASTENYCTTAIAAIMRGRSILDEKSMARRWRSRRRKSLRDELRTRVQPIQFAASH